jgi:hypothetical protein
MRDAGFRDVRIEPLVGAHSIAVATKESGTREREAG